MARIRSPSHRLSAVSRPAAGSSSRRTLGSRRIGAGDGDELPFALAELARRAVAQLARCRRVERRATQPRRSLAVGAEGRGADVLLDAEVVVELEGLEGAGEPAAHALVGRQPVEPLPSSRTAPSAVAKPVTASMTLVLPAPFGPMSPTTAPAGTTQVDVVDRDDTAVADGERLDLERSVRRRRVGVGRVVSSRVGLARPRVGGRRWVAAGADAASGVARRWPGPRGMDHQRHDDAGRR